MNDRQKEQKRQGAFAFRGNASVAEATIGPAGVVKSPNRKMEQYRSSNRGRRVA